MHYSNACDILNACLRINVCIWSDASANASHILKLYKPRQVHKACPLALSKTLPAVVFWLFSHLTILLHALFVLTCWNHLANETSEIYPEWKITHESFIMNCLQLLHFLVFAHLRKRKRESETLCLHRPSGVLVPPNTQKFGDRKNC